MKAPVRFAASVLLGFLIGAAALFVFFRLSDSAAVKKMIVPDYSEARSGISVSADSSDLIDVALDVAGYIKNSDFESLSSIVHPTLGVVFIPYSTVDFSSNKCFSASEVAQFGTNTTKYVWGTMDGTGSPIEMTPEAYFARFVFNVDYTQASIIGIDHIVHSGNALENVTEEFPNSKFIDLFYPGTTENDNLDWSTLRLVFEEYEGKYMLTAVIHSEWTV